MKNSPYSVRNATTRRPTEALEDKASFLPFHSQGSLLFSQDRFLASDNGSPVQLRPSQHLPYVRTKAYILFYMQINSVSKGFVPRGHKMYWIAQIHSIQAFLCASYIINLLPKIWIYAIILASNLEDPQLRYIQE